jgi:tryptophan synthase beta chain
MHANLFDTHRGIFLSATDEQALEAAFHVSKTEGIIPALETAHAFAVIDQLNLKKEDVLVICLSGRGDKDLATYMKHM